MIPALTLSNHPSREKVGGHARPSFIQRAPGWGDCRNEAGGRKGQGGISCTVSGREAGEGNHPTGTPPSHLLVAQGQWESFYWPDCGDQSPRAIATMMKQASAAAVTSHRGANSMHEGPQVSRALSLCLSTASYTPRGGRSLPRQETRRHSPKGHLLRLASFSSPLRISDTP